MTHPTTTEDLKKEISKTATLLTQLRDEAKVKVHLAGMDIKKAWDQLLPKIDEAEQLAKSAAETATEATLKTIKSTTESVQKLVKSL